METYLLKFIERVRAESRDGENDIASQYTIIKHQNGLLKQKHGLTTEAGGVKDNVKKNRYKDILPYDQTRVVLSPTTPEYQSDYINANFIKGATGSRTYIATQGPLNNTVVDFWRMVWQYDIRVIIMACREFELGKKKCEVYWAPRDDPSTFGPFTVSTVEESPTNEEVIVRTLAVKHCDETRTVSHFQYMAWPDHGIPVVADGILGMMDSVRVRQGCHPGPLLVHCSAGCGRTGVICAIDIVNDLLLKKKIGEDFSIMDLVLELRRQRPSAVQTKEQYEFVFHTVAQMFEKFLQECSQKHQHQDLQIEPSQSHYANVLPPKPALRSLSNGYATQNTRKPPTLRPRSSHPHSSANMNDTYAVVNKFKQPATVPRLVSHHYDNENVTSQKTTTSDLYSIVKPKNRAVANAPASTDRAYDRTWPPNRMTTPEMDCNDYEPVPGEFQMRNSQLYPSLPQGSSQKQHNSDDDYEYVSNPIRETNSSQCSPGGIGFKCRVRKPKGPRDPPSQWNRPER
ncbi:tyrosine-protein phosphatase non-receptor type 18 isoform X1 [Tachysurus vachellii]|uniref:tyrosine-protein phosphatase non-receptor type 18 isoform X1 n=1 Tax=Tachysurus vachellii TaxID=175792 RepID=UPI00296B4B37|nr:tyrosine-protein phosphatase non-receptor type 18 isoform X1 [Tachysurus vachellii]XP_060737343.1 tyrosine-protein phosphatase non-receptor type 18 isoform X1 [Tachysurus vachellii]